MATEAISKLQPHRTMYLRGFDRRGCVAAITQASSTGFKVTGTWGDLADFVVLMLHDMDDVFGHVMSTKYLPDTDFTNVVLDFDLAITSGMSPISPKNQSVPWGMISYIKGDGTKGTVTLPVTTASGMSSAKRTYTVTGTPVAYDRVYLTYLSNIVFDHVVAAGETTVDIAYAMWHAINNAAWTTITPVLAIMATWSSGSSSFDIYSARWGKVDVSGTAVTFSSSQPVGAIDFLGCNAGDIIIINGDQYEIASVTDKTNLVLTSSAGVLSGVQYLAPGGGAEGNGIALEEMHKTPTTQISPNGCSKLTGGASPSSMHVKIDFSALGLSSLRQAWLTFAPPMPYDSDSGNTHTLKAFESLEFSYVFSSWSRTDPSGKLPLKVAGKGSQLVKSHDDWCTLRASGSGNWYKNSGYFIDGFARYSQTTGDTAVFTYVCQAVHDLYLGSWLGYDQGSFSATLDGISLPDVLLVPSGSTSAEAQYSGRRLVQSGVAAGKHKLVLTVAQNKPAYIDYVQAVVLSDVEDPTSIRSDTGVALDYDTDQTYKLSPQRALWLVRKYGLIGDVDYYKGVFFLHKRVRYGGYFHSTTVTIAGAFNAGLYGDKDALFMQFGGTAYGSGTPGSYVQIGVAVFQADTLTTLSQRFVNAINALFTGVRAETGSTPGELKIYTLSPINGFTFFLAPFSTTAAAWNSGTAYVYGDIVVYSGHIYYCLVANTGQQPNTHPTYWQDKGVIGTFAKTGDIDAGNEGIWQIDTTQSQPLNKAAADYLSDMYSELVANSMTMSVALSQEILWPPYDDGISTGWAQRYPDGVGVLTDTGFGSGGAGFVENVSGSTITQTGHGYETGFTVKIASTTKSGSWIVTKIDADNYSLTTAVVVDTGYSPSIGDTVLTTLKTTQCNFNPSTVTDYMTKCFKQVAQIAAAAGVSNPMLQLGEVGYFFFSRTHSLAVSGFSNNGGHVQVETALPHLMSTGQTAIICGTKICDGTQTITVVDSTHILTSVAWPGGSPAARGFVNGAGMPVYDASTRAGHTFAKDYWTQDDEPDTGDASYLSGLISTHAASIVSAVKAVVPGARFEVLLPEDVNHLPCYYTDAVPYPQGGRFNAAVNIPAAWHTKAGSSLDRLKMEALSWGVTYLNLDNTRTAASYPFKVLSWDKDDCVFLMPVFSGAVAISQIYDAWKSSQVPMLCLWAFDHAILYSWRQPDIFENQNNSFSTP